MLILYGLDTKILFQLVDVLKLRFSYFISSFIINLQFQLLYLYLNQGLCIYLTILLRFSYLLEYKGLKPLIPFFNVLLGLINLSIIYAKLSKNFSIDRIIKIINSILLFISLYLGLILKYDSILQKMNHLSYLNAYFFNNHIANRAFISSYIWFQKILI